MKNYLLQLILLLTVSACSQQTRLEMFKNEYIFPQVEGEIIDTELWKGNILIITFKGTDGRQTGVLNQRSVLNEITKGKYFKKFENSNKCFVKDKDSILFFDSINLELIPKMERDSMQNFMRWPTEKLNKKLKIE